MTDTHEEVQQTRCVDLTGEVCPMTFVRAKLYLDEIGPGEVLEIVLKAGEQMQDLPRSIKNEGHQIESVREDGGRYHLLVRRKP